MSRHTFSRVMPTNPNTALGRMVNRNTALGQTFTVPVELPQNGLNLTIRQQYERLRAWCREQYGPGFCDSVFPDNPIYLPPAQEQRFTKSPVFWVLIGMVISRVLFRR